MRGILSADLGTAIYCYLSDNLTAIGYTVLSSGSNNTNGGTVPSSSGNYTSAAYAAMLTMQTQFCRRFPRASPPAPAQQPSTPLTAAPAPKL